MVFRDLGKQYDFMKEQMDRMMQEVIEEADFIQGSQVKELEEVLAEYTGVRHCISCGNGTDALQLALMAWNIGTGDAVFVPDFTFFSSGEVVAAVGAVPIFVDVEEDTLNISVEKLEEMVGKISKESKLCPKAVIAVDLFGQPANYKELRKVTDKYGLYLLEDGAQGFGGAIEDKRVCAFGDISTTSFFPAKPLGCYGDGGAIFTDNDEWAQLLRSLRVHGKGQTKYDNVRIGMNSRLDTLQAAVLLTKFPIFRDRELEESDRLAGYYTDRLKEYVNTPYIREGYHSSWAQYTIQLKEQKMRDGLQRYLKEEGIPSMVYYQKPMHKQIAFAQFADWYPEDEYQNTSKLCTTVLSLPFHPYMERQDSEIVVKKIIEYAEKYDEKE